MRLRTILTLAPVVLLFLFLVLGFNEPGKALAQSGSFSETFRRSSEGKAKFSRSFSVSDASIPYTLTLTHGNRDGSQRAKKITVILNGAEVTTLRKSNGSLVAAVRLQQNNEISLTMKGGSSESQLSVTIEPTRTVLLNSPSDSDFNSKQEGVGYPFSVAVDSNAHRAYLADGASDSVIEFDINEARVARRFDNVDNDAIPGSSGTSGVSVNTNSHTLVAVSPADGSRGNSAPSGSVSVINMDNNSIRTTTLNNLNPLFVANNPNTNVAAFIALFAPSSRKAYFFDVAANTVTTKDESASLISVTANTVTNEFIFTAAAEGKRPSLVVYSAAAPFRRQQEIASSAAVGTVFDRIAVNPANNLAVALNLRDGAAFIFDTGAGTEIARLPLRFVGTRFAEGDVAVNPETNMAVIVNRSLNILYIIDLATTILRGEYPLPNGINPLSVGVDTKSNVAVIGENGFSSARHNGSVILVKLPERE